MMREMRMFPCSEWIERNIDRLVNHVDEEVSMNRMRISTRDEHDLCCAA